jgi:alcohol dehydrogenase class IV
VCDPSNLEAAGNMILGSMTGEISFTLLTRLTIAHPMANPPCVYLKIPHGLSVAILLPRVVRFNLISCPEKLVNIARLMDEAVDGLNLYEAANQCVLAIERLSSDLGIPRGFKDLGMTEEHVEIFTRDIVSGPLAAGRLNANPRRVNPADVAELYKLSM